MSKTTQFLKILLSVSQAPSRCLSESRLKEIMGDPAKSTWHRLINELTEGSKDIPALLIETKSPDSDEKFFCVNTNGWQAFIDAHEEGKFLLECYKQVGHLLQSDFTDMIFELSDVDRKQVGRLNRKFLHLVKVQSLKTAQNKKNLDTIIHALIGEKMLEITYDGGLKTVRPLTLCQHRDELYLMCYRQKDGGQWEKRTYKLSRITGIKVLDKKFPYPAKAEWDPFKEYQNSSGIVLGEPKRVQIKVFGQSRKILAEKDFFNSQLINTDAEFDTYLCIYTNPSEFLGQIFVYAQDIEIVDDEKLRDQFTEKALASLKRNHLKVMKVS